MVIETHVMVGTTVKKVGQYNNLRIQPASSSEKFKGRFTGKKFLLSGKNKPILKSSPISTLNPFIGSDDILRVGGRLKKAPVLISREKHPVIIPGKHHIATLIVTQFHVEVQGRHFT